MVYEKGRGSLYARTETGLDFTQRHAKAERRLARITADLRDVEDQRMIIEHRIDGTFNSVAMINLKSERDRLTFRIKTLSLAVLEARAELRRIENGH